MNYQGQLSVDNEVKTTPSFHKSGERAENTLQRKLFHKLRCYVDIEYERFFTCVKTDLAVLCN